ncbi:hypothetical protein AE922_21195 [Xanthomonas arboricola]|nr:hypothetical protein AE922_21195 [Xanthomonas arboricola]KOB23635.1 hypothetical protein AE927_19380 [Xanthomonas arboricola]
MALLGAHTLRHECQPHAGSRKTQGRLQVLDRLHDVHPDRRCVERVQDQIGQAGKRITGVEHDFFAVQVRHADAPAPGQSVPCRDGRDQRFVQQQFLMDRRVLVNRGAGEAYVDAARQERRGYLGGKHFFECQLHPRTALLKQTQHFG